MASTLPSPSLEEDDDKKSLELLPEQPAKQGESTRVQKLLGSAGTPPPRTLKSRHLTLISIGGTIGTVSLRFPRSSRRRQLTIPPLSSGYLLQSRIQCGDSRSRRSSRILHSRRSLLPRSRSHPRRNERFHSNFRIFRNLRNSFRLSSTRFHLGWR